MSGSAGNALTRIHNQISEIGQNVPNLEFHTFFMNAIVCHTSVLNYEIVSAYIRKLLVFEKFLQPQPPPLQQTGFLKSTHATQSVLNYNIMEYFTLKFR